MHASPSAMRVGAGRSHRSGESWAGGGDTLRNEISGRVGLSMDCLEYLIDECDSVYVVP